MNIPFSEIVFTGSFLSDGLLPRFRGATLRGALGTHLRNTVCNSFKRKCSECFLREQCAYSLFFDGFSTEENNSPFQNEKIPQPFMFMLNDKDTTKIKTGEPFSFGMKIFGKANEFFPYVAYSLFKAGKAGIGSSQIYFSLDAIQQLIPTDCSSNTVLYEKKNSNTIRKPIAIDGKITEQEIPSKILNVKLLTPLRIREAGKTAKQLSLTTLIKAGLRRLTLLNFHYGDKNIMPPERVRELLTLSEKVPMVKNTISSFGFERYSGRQEKKMLLDGVIGSMTFADVPSELVNILRWNEIYGIGKSTSFGFGRIAVS